MEFESVKGFEVNARRFASEEIDGEVIILDVEEGSYFSLGGSATSIWNAIGTGASLEAIKAWARRGFADGNRAEIGEAIDAVVETLAKEGIIGQVEAKDSRALDALGTGAKIFEPARCEKFTDMQDLLTLDPIHDVDETGWPHRLQ